VVLSQNLDLDRKRLAEQFLRLGGFPLALQAVGECACGSRIRFPSLSLSVFVPGLVPAGAGDCVY
jgi:hypothetical protein